MAKGFLREYYPFFLVGLFAVVIDYLLLHYPNPVAETLNFSIILEIPSYFLVKYIIVVGSFYLVSEIVKVRSSIGTAFWAAIAGSGIFSIYYFFTRPDLFGFLDDTIYNLRDTPVLTFEVSVVIYIIHAIAIFSAVMIGKHIEDNV